MNWDALGALAEIVGAVAVVVTLVYLALQIRSSTRIAKAAARQAIAENALAMVEDLAEDPSLAELMIRDLKLEPVDEVDNVRLLARAYRNMRHYENLLYQYRAGMLDEDEWQGFRENLKALMAWRAMREYWANEGHYYSTRFREEIAGIEREREKSGDLPEYQYVIRETGPRDSDQ